MPVLTLEGSWKVTVTARGFPGDAPPPPFRTHATVAGGGALSRFVKEVSRHRPGILVRGVVGFVFLLERIVKFVRVAHSIDAWLLKRVGQE